MVGTQLGAICRNPILGVFYVLWAKQVQFQNSVSDHILYKLLVAQPGM
jgi:hypothetical protein